MFGLRTAALCTLGILLIALALWHRPEGADDFGPFYRAAELASHHQNVYSNPTWSPKQSAPGRFLPYLRTPVYATVLAPFTLLPYSAARYVWIAVLIAGSLGCLWLFPSPRERLAIALTFSFPLADALMVGQDISLVLLIGLAAARIFATGREFLAGVVASLLGIKMTYLPAAGIAFLAQSRRGFWGFLTGVSVQFGVSFAVWGANWPSEYIAQLRSPLLDPPPSRMLNLHEVAQSLALPSAVWITAALALYAVFWFLCKRVSLPDALLIALPLGMIASPHCKVYDGVVLLPLLVKVVSRKSPAGLLALLALTPAFYLMVLMGTPPIVLAGDLLVIAATVAAAWRIYQTGSKTEAVLSS